jgi:hypothetical protein
MRAGLVACARQRCLAIRSWPPSGAATCMSTPTRPTPTEDRDYKLLDASTLEARATYVGVISGLVRFSDTGPPPGG